MSAGNVGQLLSRGNNVGVYFFWIENLPERYTWKHLKDLVRSEAEHIGWTEMAFYPNGQTGDRGWARLPRADEAGHLYSFLSTHVLGNKRLRVHLWETPISGPPRLLRCNCDQPGRHSPIGAVVGRMALDPSWHVPQAVPLVQAQAPAYQYLVPSNYAPQAPTLAVSSLTTDMASLRVTPTAAQLVAQRDAYNAYAARQAHLARQQQGGSIYLTTAGGIPVNVENGAVRTESRGVFVGKLKYSARARDVEALFQKAGKIIDCKLRVDPTTGKSKGSATILYAFAAQAMVAVEKFNNYEFMGKRLEVRIDKESTAISPPAGARAPSTEVQPIIVNGSNKVDGRKDSQGRKGSATSR